MLESLAMVGSFYNGFVKVDFSEWTLATDHGYLWLSMFYMYVSDYMYVYRFLTCFYWIIVLAVVSPPESLNEMNSCTN